MSRLAVIKNEVRAHLHGRCFLRRDRQARALFLTDYPLHNPDKEETRSALEADGFTVEEENGLWRVDLGEARRNALIQQVSAHALPADAPLEIASLCKSLLMQGNPAHQPWPLLRQTLLWLDEGQDALLLSMLREQAAVCKRTHAPLPAAVAYLIMEEISAGREMKC